MRGVDDPQAWVAIRWRTLAEGGRQSPPVGPVYAPTAVFDGVGGAAESSSGGRHFSLLIEYESDSEDATSKAKIEFLDREGVAPYLALGQRLGIMEGSARVADAEVVQMP